MTTELAFVNDALVPADQASVSIYDTGFLHAAGLFETMRSYQDRVFRLADHLHRLLDSAQQLGLRLTQSADDLAQAVTAVLNANHLTDALIRLTVTSGATRNPDPDNPPPNTLIVTAQPLPCQDLDQINHGVMVVINPCKQNPHDPLVTHKTLAYFSRLIFLQQAQQKQAAEALIFSPTNHLIGACLSNVFLVRDHRLLTVPLDAPAFPGLTRRTVIELAQQNHIELEEKQLVIKDLLQADEIFLTNTVMELIPVSRVEQHVVGSEKPGPIYRRLHQLYRQAALNP